jgi:hypothetical protein
MSQFHSALFNNGTQNHNLLFIVVDLTLCTCGFNTVHAAVGWCGMVKVSGRQQVWLVVAATEEESGGSRGTNQTVAGGEQQETDHISANTNKNKHYLLACVLCLPPF